MLIGIVILNYNTAADVAGCVKSINGSTQAKYRIYIVDNASTDASLSLLRSMAKEDENVVLLESDHNGGYSYGNNIGCRAAAKDECDYILISNPDVVYYDNAIDIMLRDLKSNDQIGVIGPSASSLDEEESQLIRKTYTAALYLCSKKPFLYFAGIFPSMRTEYSYPPKDSKMPFLFHGMVRGACFMMPTALFAQIGYFDDNVFLYSEEWIIAKKLEDRGYWAAFDSRARTLHKEATSTNQLGTGFQSYHLYLSAFYYLKEYACVGAFGQFFFYLQNILSYTFKSARDQSYRKLLKKFARKSNSMLLHCRSRIEQ